MLRLRQDRNEAQNAKYVCGCPGVPDVLMCVRLGTTWRMREMFCFGVVFIDFCVAKVEETNILISVGEYLQNIRKLLWQKTWIKRDVSQEKWDSSREKWDASGETVVTYMWVVLYMLNFHFFAIKWKELIQSKVIGDYFRQINFCYWSRLKQYT